MIPKRIAYCWFGGNEKPKLIQRCIDSWKKIVPDYEIIELNENNCDIESINYAKQAYEQKKWAFVSDVMRFVWLKENSGITLDADIQMIQPFSDEILSNSAFTSQESSGKWISAVIASEKDHVWVNKVLKFYQQNNFEYNPQKITNTVILDKINRSWYEKKVNDVIYLYGGVAIYPRHYFECKSWATGQIELSKDSYCIHHYTASWIERK